MIMKPWERDIQELERYFVKTLEAENIKFNRQVKPEADNQSLSNKTLALIQHLKERNKKEVMAQYFNYSFNEETYKTYINQQV